MFGFQPKCGSSSLPACSHGEEMSYLADYLTREQRRSVRIKEQLGMSKSTASKQLMKTLLFSCVLELKKNTCFVCGELIQHIDDFSIEHKIPWEGRDTALFWDLNNIAYSHLRCNKPHKYPDNKGRVAHNRKSGDEGMAWCGSCQAFLLVDNFSKNKSTWNGYQTDCKKCRAKRQFGRLTE
jgi:hypothetical protein